MDTQPFDLITGKEHKTHGKPFKALSKI